MKKFSNRSVMKKIFLAPFVSISFLLFVHAQSEKIPVFISGTEGYKSFRIPAIIRASNGDLLTFCEGRVNGSADFGDVDIVMKRSNDEGKTWSAIKVIVDKDSLQAGNPAPVVDLTDPTYPNGRIFLFYNTGNNNESEIRKGNGLREVFYTTSTDNGVTWSTSNSSGTSAGCKTVLMRWSNDAACDGVAINTGSCASSSA